MGMRGERQGVARRSGLEGEEELEVEVGVEVELELELELEPGLPTANPVGGHRRRPSAPNHSTPLALDALPVNAPRRRKPS